VSFLLKLIDSGGEVLFADLPELNGAMGRFMLTTMASVLAGRSCYPRGFTRC
jgi:hypothetical protein